MRYPNIKAEMSRRGLAIEALAEQLGLSADITGFKLSGEREFTLAEIERLAEIFDCSLDYLVGHQVRTDVGFL